MRVRLFSALVVFAFAGGCCTSSQPLYTPETIKQDLDLAGTWESYDVERQKFDTENPFTVKSLGGGKFEARCTAKIVEDGRARYEKQVTILHGVELDGSLYLDIESSKPAEGDLSQLLADQHLIAVAHLEGDRLQLAFLDKEKVQACAAEAHLHFTNGWGRLILNESTADLQKFVAAHRDDIFEAPSYSRRIAKPQAPD